MSTIVTRKSKELFVPESYWQLNMPVNGYVDKSGEELSTQAASGRFFKILDGMRHSHKESLARAFTRNHYCISKSSTWRDP